MDIVDMLAEEDVIVEDELGVPRKVVAGQLVPVNLVKAYMEEVGLEADDADDEAEKPSKPERHTTPSRRRKR